MFPGCVCCPRRGSFHITVRLFAGSLTLFDILMIVLMLRSHQTSFVWVGLNAVRELRWQLKNTGSGLLERGSVGPLVSELWSGSPLV